MAPESKNDTLYGDNVVPLPISEESTRKDHQCSDCGKRFVTKQKYRQHYVSIHARLGFIWCKCSKVPHDLPDKLVEHCKTAKHKKLTRRSGRSEPGYVLSCAECKVALRSCECAKEHQKMHFKYGKVLPEEQKTEMMRTYVENAPFPNTVPVYLQDLYYKYHGESTQYDGHDDRSVDEEDRKIEIKKAVDAAVAKVKRQYEELRDAETEKLLEIRAAFTGVQARVVKIEQELTATKHENRKLRKDLEVANGRIQVMQTVVPEVSLEELVDVERAPTKLKLPAHENDKNNTDRGQKLSEKEDE